MSIATDEALEWHGLHGDEPGDRDSTYSAEELDAAYIAGRTAEPTEAEVEASAFAQFKVINNSSWKLTEEQYREAWDALPDMVSDDFLCKARIGLEAARKAVTE